MGGLLVTLHHFPIKKMTHGRGIHSYCTYVICAVQIHLHIMRAEDNHAAFECTGFKSLKIEHHLSDSVL